MVEIQNTTASRIDLNLRRRITTSQIRIVNRKKSDVSVTLYRNLTDEETFISEKLHITVVGGGSPKFEFTGEDPMSVKNIATESAEFVTKQKNTAKVVIIH